MAEIVMNAVSLLFCVAIFCLVMMKLKGGKRNDH